MSATTRFTDPTLPEPPALYLALELSNRSWKLAFSTGHGQKPRFRNVPARDLDTLTREIALARKRFDLSDSVPVISCYEAGRDGFWIHRFLQSQSHCFNLVVDSASIEVNRRQRRLKTDRIDARKLLSMLIRYHNGELRVWSVVHVPSPEAEDARHLHRELLTLKSDRTRITNRIKGLLAAQGLSVSSLNRGKGVVGPCVMIDDLSAHIFQTRRGSGVILGIEGIKNRATTPNCSPGGGRQRILSPLRLPFRHPGKSLSCIFLDTDTSSLRLNPVTIYVTYGQRKRIVPYVYTDARLYRPTRGQPNVRVTTPNAASHRAFKWNTGRYRLRLSGSPIVIAMPAKPNKPPPPISHNGHGPACSRSPITKKT